MRIKFLLLFLILIITIYIFISDEDKKVNLGSNRVKKSRVRKKKSSKKKKLVLYWANWCGVCQKIKPNWNKAKSVLKSKYPNLKIEEINCDNLDLNKSYILVDGVKESLEGVPTILIRNGINDIEYEKGDGLKGDRSVDDLIKFCEMNM